MDVPRNDEPRREPGRHESYRAPISTPKKDGVAGRFFFHAHNETLSAIAMCVNNPDRSPLKING
jgi:hypothetical protein